MNIFILDADPERAARYHCDKHVVKMIVESAQLMSTAHHELGSSTDGMYRKTHANHPCAVWARASSENYQWLHSLTVALCYEYTHRYGRIHKVEHSGLLQQLAESPPTGATSRTPFALAMPDLYRGDDVVQAYRHLYAAEKISICAWTRRPMPSWLRKFGYHPFIRLK